MTTSHHQQQQPWVEKYRPKELHAVAHQNEIIATLQNAVLTNQLPHLLFYGPPGTGKTSVALALCKTLWSPSQWKRRVLELNASDERGISIVRDKIKHFASLSVNNSSSNNNNDDEMVPSGNMKKKVKTFFTKGGGNENENSNNNNINNNNTNTTSATTAKEQSQQQQHNSYPNPPFKIIILDEADTVTPDAQAALRRIIEANSRVTRFILICNYVTRIIEPLASRCAKFRFQSLPMDCMKEKLLEICKHEECDMNIYTQYYIDPIIQYSNGDMRRAITTLQSVYTIDKGSQSIQHKVGSPIILSPSVIAEIVGVPSIEIVNELWETCTNSKSQKSITYDEMHQTIEDILASGYSAQLLLSSLLSKILQVDDEQSTSDDHDNSNMMMNDVTTKTTFNKLDELSLAQIAIRIAEAEKNMLDGADEYLQFMTVCSLIYSCCTCSN